MPRKSNDAPSRLIEGMRANARASPHVPTHPMIIYGFLCRPQMGTQSASAP